MKMLERQRQTETETDTDRQREEEDLRGSINTALMERERGWEGLVGRWGGGGGTKLNNGLTVLT